MKYQKAGKRKRILNEDELTKVWHATVRQGYAHGTVCQLLALTGQREGEVANLRRPWINEIEQTITLPEWITRNSKEHTFPYGNIVAEILEGIPPTSACSQDVTDPRRLTALTVITFFERLIS